MSLLTQFAATEASGSVFEALGIDWKMLILQIVAFLILVWLLKKYVYPWLMKSVDERQDAIEASTKAAEVAQLQAENAAKEVVILLSKARKDAKDIVATAKDEAAAAVEAADSKAVDRAKNIVASAHEQIEKDVIAAKKALHNETIELVALATEQVIGKTMTAPVDTKVIAAALSEAK